MPTLSRNNFSDQTQDFIEVLSYFQFLQYIRSVLPIRNITSFFFFTTIDPPEEFQNSTAFPHLAQSNFSWGIFSTVDPYDKHTPDVYFPFFVLMEFIGRYIHEN